MWLGIIKAVMGFGSGILGKYQDRKSATATANAAWETATGRSMIDSWKDEYVTIVVTFPLWQIFVGNLLYAFNGNELILIANEQSLAQVGDLMATPYGSLMMAVVLAAVGLKTVKGIFK